MKLREFLYKIKCLPRDLEVCIHEIDDDGVTFKPVKDVSISVFEKRLSFGVKKFSDLEFELMKKRGFFRK